MTAVNQKSRRNKLLVQPLCLSYELLVIRNVSVFHRVFLSLSQMSATVNYFSLHRQSTLHNLLFFFIRNMQRTRCCFMIPSCCKTASYFQFYMLVQYVRD